MTKRGILIVVSGFSGSGKGTLMKALIAKHNNYALSVSATTRQPRAGEVDGISYFFKTVEEFEEMIREDAFIEYANYVNNYYGTPKEYVDQQLNMGMDVFLEIDIQGALKVKNQFPDAVLMFIVPPGAAELKRRLTGRGTEDSDTIRQRLCRAAEEAEVMEAYDYLIINEELDVCVDQVHRIIKSEHGKVSRNQEFINKIKEELICFSKGV